MRSAPINRGPTSPRLTVCSVCLPPGKRASAWRARDRPSSRTTRFPRATTPTSGATSCTQRRSRSPSKVAGHERGRCEVRSRRVSHRPGPGGTRPTSSARAARRAPAHGAWPRIQFFGVNRLAHSTSNDRHKSCAVSNLGRCLKVLCVAGVTHKPLGSLGIRLGVPCVTPTTRLTGSPGSLLTRKIVKTRGLRRALDSRPVCCAARCDADSRVRWLRPLSVEQDWTR